jgi:hypothetical protein
VPAVGNCQLIGPDDPRWHRFGLNVPAELERPARSEGLEVNNDTPGQLLVSCATVPYAERYRFFLQKAGAPANRRPSARRASRCSSSSTWTLAGATTCSYRP